MLVTRMSDELKIKRSQCGRTEKETRRTELESTGTSFRTDGNDGSNFSVQGIQDSGDLVERSGSMGSERVHKTKTSKLSDSTGTTSTSKKSNE